MLRALPRFVLGVGLLSCGGEDPSLVDSSAMLDPNVAGRQLARVDSVPIYRTPSDFFCTAVACEGGLATDLGFNPKRPSELWVTFRQTYTGAPCEMEGGDRSGCDALGGKVTIIKDVQAETLEAAALEDGNAWHFMRRVTALAFSEDDTFATVGEARTGNFTNDRGDYMGPTLWSSDPAIFAVDFGRNGSHLDMLHATPFGMGIAHERDHVFWAFNGQVGAVDRYDFLAPHEPGGDDHSDGMVARYVTGQLARLENIPSHMEFAPDKRRLLIADTGHGRVVVLDTQTGNEGARIQTAEDQVHAHQVNDALLSELVPPGVLTWPSGLAVRAQGFVVADAASNQLYEFSFEGELRHRFETGLEAGSLAGLEFGPDGRLYGVISKPASVVRFDWPKN